MNETENDKSFSTIIVLFFSISTCNILMDLLPPPGGIAILRVCWLVRCLVRSFIKIGDWPETKSTCLGGQFITALARTLAGCLRAGPVLR